MTAPSRTWHDYPPEHLLAWTPRQVEVLELLAKGRSNPQIAEELGVSLQGAKWHVREVMSKLGVDSRDEAADYWRQRNGLPARLQRSVRGIAVGLSLKWVAVAGGIVVAGLAAVAVIVALQNSGDPQPVAPDTTPTVGVETPTAVPSPPGTPTTSGQPTNVDGPLYQFSRQTAVDQREVVYYDLGSRQQAWTVRYGGAGDEAIREIPVDGGLLLVSAQRIHRLRAFESQSTTLFAAPSGSTITGAAVSPDGELLAVADADPSSGEWQVSILDMGTGDVVRTFGSSHPEFQEFAGVPARAVWSEENAMVTFHGETDTGELGSLATLRMNGQANVYQPEGWPIFAPDGNYVGWMEGETHECLPERDSGSSAVMFDLRYGVRTHRADIGEALTQRTVEGDYGVGLQWSGDSYRFSFAIFEVEGPGCDWAETPVRLGSQGKHDTGPGWHDTPDDAIAQMNDGPRVEAHCDSQWRSAVATEPGETIPRCEDTSPLELRVNGIGIGDGTGLRGLGLYRGSLPSQATGSIVFVGTSANSTDPELVVHDMGSGEATATPIDSYYATFGDGFAYYLRGGEVRQMEVASGVESVLPGRFGDATGVNHLAVSPDEQYLAIASSNDYTDWEVVILRTDTMEEVASLEGGEGELDMVNFGYAWQLQWRDDSAGVTVRGGTDSERPGGLLTLWLDGTYTKLPENSYRQIAPNGRLVVTGLGVEVQGCMFVNSSTFTLVDLETLETVQSVQRNGDVASVGHWAPDSSEYIFPTYEGPYDDECGWTMTPDQWWKLVPGEELEPASDPRADDPWPLEWSVHCDGVEAQMRYSCDRGSVAELRLGGSLVSASYLGYRVLAVLE